MTVRIIGAMSLSRKDQIKQTAAKMFRKRGYQATSMRDIAKELGMEAPSLYNHIRSKQQILSELLLMVADEFTQGMAKVKRSVGPESAQLEQLVKLHVDITMEHSDAVSLLTGEWVHLEKEVAEEFIKKRDAYEQDFRTILKASIEKGHLEKVDVELALFSILSTLRWLYSWCGRNPEVNRRKLEKQMVKILLPRKKS
jgi:TetR/AcrR family transcriptional regulator, cholesterol catabolism regulator